MRSCAWSDRRQMPVLYANGGIRGRGAGATTTPIRRPPCSKAVSRGVLRAALRLLLQLLERILPEAAYPGVAEQVAQHWSAHGLPADAEARVLAAAAEPDRWRDHLRIPADTGRTSPFR